LATISSGLWRFFGIVVLLSASRHTLGWTSSMGVDQSFMGVLCLAAALDWLRS
jgi:hypothetical protein